MTFFAARSTSRRSSIFAIVLAITLGITYWASKRASSALGFYAAGRQITGVQNGLAIAGDYMSAASFLGIAGLISLFGFDGFLYSIGFLVAFLTVMFLLAERCATRASTRSPTCSPSGCASARCAPRPRSGRWPSSPST